MTPKRRYLLKFFDGDDPIAQHDLSFYYQNNFDTVFPVQFEELPTMPRPRQTSRHPRREGPPLLQRLFDPDRGHPILRKILLTVAPIAIAFLTKQLPTWLSGIDLDNILDPDHDEET